MTTEMALTKLAFAQAQTNVDAQLLVAQLRVEMDKAAFATEAQAAQSATEITPDAATEAALAQLQDEAPPPEPGIGVLVNKTA